MSAFHLPPVRTRGDGAERRVGFEFEYAGPGLREVGERIAAAYGGELREAGPFALRVVDTRHGDYKVELDADVLQQQRYLQALEAVGIELDAEEQASLESVLTRLAEPFVPWEVVTPPLPLSALSEVETLRELLRDAGAKGTEAGLLYAFGLHINPELPDDDEEGLRRYLQAYLLLEDNLRELARTDLLRRLSTFIDPFPPEYRRRVLRRDYRPELAELVGDYLLLNPTRNRSLDMLPIFAGLRPEQVQAGVRPSERSKVHSRPAFHWRLPNCRVDVAEWRVSHEWGLWVEVERLAADAERLEEGLERYERDPHTPWEQVQRWLEELFEK